MPVDEREAPRDVVAAAPAPPRAPPPPARRGISTWNSAARSRPCARPRAARGAGAAMRKLDGTMPLAAPECTPSVSTSTVSSAVDDAAQRGRRPRAGRSCRSPESRQITRSGSPMRAASASMYAGRSGLPLSSLASIRTTQRACGAPARCTRLDRGERAEDRVAVVLRRRGRRAGRRGGPASTGRARRPSPPSPAACRSGRRAGRSPPTCRARRAG